MDERQDEWQRARSLFQRLWGYDGFRSPQGDIIRALLNQQDVLAILPTGAGKSICFQLPALLRSGLTVVVSPLVALMDAQVVGLQAKGLPAATFHSEIPRSQQFETLQRLRQGQLRLLYLSPESLLSQRIWPLLLHPEVRLQGLVLDEAHCLAQWGDSFRPAYRRLGAARQALATALGRPIPIAAFTATATPTDRATIATVLSLQEPVLFERSPYRANLQLQVQRCWVLAQRWWRLLAWLRSHPGESGLIYARSRRDCESLAARLIDRGQAVAAYHAGLPPGDRRRLERDWSNGTLAALVCTSAFGMGIDRPDVRWIVHWHVPLIPAEYIQEIGRAGRDGKPAEVLLLTSEPTGWLEPTDRQLSRFFQQRQQQQLRDLWRIARQLPPAGSIAEIADRFNNGPIALSWLHTLDRLVWRDPFHYQLSDPLPRSMPLPTQSDRLMQRYGSDRGCRWHYLLTALGWPPATHWRCGRCDRCC
ncbi:MAG: ATP-dependent DNA helicase RecQ [Oscillatoriales cyanobacterium]|nr:MAG: ATP-dependent DNA helicase RecQ [Oscillatoriales cyanobacterium]